MFAASHLSDLGRMGGLSYHGPSRFAAEGGVVVMPAERT